MINQMIVKMNRFPLLVLTALCVHLCASAYAEPIDSVAIGEYGSEWVGDYCWEFYISEHGAVIESANWEEWKPAVTPTPVGDLVVPRQLNGRPVVGIGNYAFIQDWESGDEMNITSIDIPDTVTSYGDQVFGYGCNFEEFEFKEGVTSVGNYVLMECYNLKRLKIAGTIKETGYSPFSTGGWYGGGLEELELGEGLTEIGDYWFQDSMSLKELAIPSTVTNIGSYAFTGLGGYVYDGEDYSHPISVVLPQGLKRLGDYAFGYSGGLREIVVPDSVNQIGQGVFEECRNLTNIVLGAGISQVPRSLCKECRMLKAVDCRASIGRIDAGAFYACKSLETFPFSTNLTYIGEGAFYGCTVLTGVDLSEGLTFIGGSAFDDCDAIESIRLPSTLQQGGLGDVAFGSCDRLADVYIPGTVGAVGASCFRNCSALTNVCISSGITSIGSSAFYGCAALGEIILPDTVREIRDSAFGNCKALVSAPIPDGVTSIGNSVFQGDSSLTSLRFPSACVVVPDSMCYECFSLTNVVLHDDITRIGWRAFHNCSALEHISLPAYLQRIESDAFGGCSSLREIVIPEGVTYIGGMAFRHCRSMARVVLPSGLVEIGGAAFFNCESLREIVVPASVTKLNERQFAGGLKALESIRFMGNPPSVSSWSSTFGEGTADHKFTVYYPVEFSTAWSGAVADITAMGIDCHAVLPYEGYHAWLSTDRSHYAEGESADITIHLSNAFEGDVYAYLVPKNGDAFEKCSIAGMTCLGETNELQTVRLAAGVTEHVITNGFSFLDGPAEPSFEVLVLTNAFSSTFSTNTIYAVEALDLSVTNVSPVVSVSVSPENRVETEIGREERIEWFAQDVEADEVEGFSYGWWVNSSWREGGTGTNGAFAVTFNDVGEKSVKLRVTDKDGGWTEQIVRYWINPASYKTVVFDLGDYGSRSGGGALSQIVKVGEDAVPPEVETDPDEDYIFDGWDSDYANVLSNVTIRAVYKYNPVPREFRLSLSSDTVSEGQSAGIRFIIKRTGTPSKSLEVQLRVDREGVLDIPKSVVIPAGNSSMILTVRPIDNSVVDGKRTVNVTCSAEKYADGEIAITVTDDEVPSVRIELDGERLREGGAVLTGRVVRDLVTDEPLTVYLSGVSTSRCRYPSSVVIPAGEESVSFEIAVIDNDTAEALANMTLRAAAAGYAGDMKTIAVEDDDVPGVRLDIFPERVSEGAGTKAAYATLTRVDNDKLAKAITVRLSATPANQLILPDVITIPAHTLSARFSIGTVDNALDDGDRLVEVTGAVVIESCGCNGQPSSGEAIASQLMIVDDDGPTLMLKASPSTLKEGVEEAGWLTVSHNSSTLEDVTVELSFDVAGEIDLPEEVVIPAGQQSVVVPIRTLDDGVQDGGRLVSVYAEDKAGTFASGSTWVQVSDQNLPDLCLEQASVSPNPVVGGSNCRIEFVIANNGVVAYEGSIPYRACWISEASSQSEQGTLNATGRVEGILPVGESKVVSLEMSVPVMPGNYRLMVSVDPDRSIPDLDELNNELRSDAVSVMPSFTALVDVDRLVYQLGDSISISGHAVNADGVTAAANQKLEVYIIVDGARRSFDVTTDAVGDFSYLFEPQVGEMGHYVVGTCYPGQNANVPQAEFDILGFWRNPNSYVVSDLVVGGHEENRVTVRNKSSVPLTGVTATVVGQPKGLDVAVSGVDGVVAFGSSELLIEVDAIEATEGTEYKYFSVRLESAEGATIDIPMAAYVSPVRARLTATPQNVKTTITVGKSSYLTYTITNEGAGDSGRVRIALPDVSWLRVVSGSVIDNLKSGESAKVLVEATPPVALRLNKLYTGVIGVGCENGQSFSLGLSLIPVSDENGSLKVDVVDTLTLTTQGAPHLKGATVSVTNPTTGEVVARGETDDDGVFLATNIPAGAYEVSVVADNHNSKRMEITVAPGDTAGGTVYLDYNGVSYSWKVTRTEIEDQYAIDLVMDYDTSVPAPAMKVTAPEEIPALSEGESFVCGIEIENCGLIALQDIRLLLGGSIGEYTYEQISPDISLLPAKSSQTIYVKFTNPTKLPRLRLAAKSSREITRDDIAQAQYAPCTTFFQTTARAICGEKGVEVLMNSNNIRMVGHVCDLLTFTAMQMLNALGNFGGNGFAPSRESGGTCGDPWGYLVDPPVSEEKLDCECAIRLIDITLGLGLDKLGVGCLKDLYEEMQSWMEMERLIKSSGNGEAASELAKRAAERLRQTKAQMRGQKESMAEVAKKIQEALALLEACSRAIGWDKISEAFGKAKEALEALKELASLLDVISAQPSSGGRARMMAASGPLTDTSDDIDPEMVQKFIDGCFGLDNRLRGLGYQGVADADQFFGDMMEEFRTIREGTAALAVCSTVSFKLSQTVTMTREAFEGSLTLQNSGFGGRLKDVKIEPVVTDGDGNNRTELFGITDRDHSGFAGSSFLGGDLQLDEGAAGTANILFVPTVQAALEEPTLYYFGGYLSYYDSVLGETVTHKLIPVPLVVNPCPQLTLDYFVQRDVYGDDPFTSDVVEPSVPAELAVLIRNNGKGEAKNTVIKSIQPQVLENDKGLAIDFALKDYSLDATALNGSTAHLGLSDVNLGTIGADECAVAQWWLTSSLEGHFSGVSATVTHLNSWGNPDTSLISDVRIHKLVRSIVADDDGLPDFMTTTDAFGNPEEIYTSQGDILPIRNDAKCTVEGSLGREVVSLNVMASATDSGWQCLTCTIDGLSDYVVESVTKGDGEQLPIRNVWITDRVFRNGTNPLYRDDIHIVDRVEQVEPVHYVVTLVRKPSEYPEVSRFEKASGSIENSVRDSVTVVFASPIDPETFDWMDVSLIAQGEWVSSTLRNGVISGLQSLVVTPVGDSNTEFVISGLSRWCSPYGRYELTVQCAGIQDANGTFGRNGKSFSWVHSGSDTTKPCVSRSQGLDGESFYVTFPEVVEGEEVSLDALSLKRDGVDIPLPAGVVVNRASDREIILSGLDDAIAEDGVYQLSYGESTATSWQVRTQAPAPATDLYITPDEGESSSDGITCATRLTVHGTLAPDTSMVDMYYVLPGGEPVRISNWNRLGQAIDATLELNGGGNVTFIIRSSDLFGNESEASLTAYVDMIPLRAKLQLVGEEDMPVEGAILTFDEDVIDTDVSKDDFELLRDGQSVLLTDVQLVKTGGRAFALSGLEAACSQDGVYSLNYNSTSVRKRSSGLKASACAPLVWNYKKLDRESPTIVAIRIDGEEARSLYTNGVSSVEIAFSENVNIQDLANDGLIGQALKIELLDGELNVTGMVRAARTDVVCGADKLAWTLPAGVIGAGTARVVVDAGLVSDEAGNKLAVGEFETVDGLKTFDFKSDIIAAVDTYAMPTWYDFDGDGLGDLVVGEKTSAGAGKVRVYRNVGTETEPRFSGFTYLQVGGSDLSIAATGCQGAQVAFGDLTGDGNDDLIVGFADGKVLMWHGTATRGTYGESEVLVTGSEQTYGSARAFVCPYDLDGDGALELAIGGLDGKFRRLKYVSGGSSVETWLTDDVGVSFAVESGRSTPVFADVNHDGCVDILSGDTAGHIWAFLGNGETWSASAVSVFDNTTSIKSDRSRIGFGDVNGDGIGDLLVGRTDGSVELALGVKTESPAFTFRVKGIYTVTFDLGEYGVLNSGDLVQSVVEGDSAVAPEVTVDDCYVFDGWDSEFGSIAADTVIRARYTHKPPVKLTVAGVIPDATTLASHGNGEYEIVYGDEVTVTVPQSVTNAFEKITECVGWIGAGSIPAAGESESLTTRMIADSTVTWSWQTAKWWLELGAENGTLSASSGWQAADSSVSVTATPVDHYVFKQWRGDLEGCSVDGAVVTLAMDRKRSVAAEFELAKHKVKIGGGTEMTMPAVGEYDYAYGSMVTVSVVNAVQYSGATQFVCTGWSAVNAEPMCGAGMQAVFKVLGDTEIAWSWQTNVLTLAEAVNAPDMTFETEGPTDWTPEWGDWSSDVAHCAIVRGVGDNASACLQTIVDGPGEVSFAWMCDLAARTTKLQFFVDDVAQGVVSGQTQWVPVSVTVYGEGPHTLRWRLFTGRSGAAETDFGSVDRVAWTPAIPPTLAEALNEDLVWTTEGGVSWRGVAKDSKFGTRDAWAVAAGLGDDATSTIETRVYGRGLLMFDWAVSCEEEYDWLEVSVDGEVRTYVTGDVGWRTDAVDIVGEGWHTVRWSYCKDELDDPDLAGANKAMLDNVVWLSDDEPPAEPEKTATESTPVPVPFEVIEDKYGTYLEAENGDYEAAANAIGKNGCPIWESFVAGLDPDKADSKFEAKITMVDGKPVISWDPALNGHDESGACIQDGVRIYRVFGSSNLTDWEIVPDGKEGDFQFFKVEVLLP